MLWLGRSEEEQVHHNRSCISFAVCMMGRASLGGALCLVDVDCVVGVVVFAVAGMTWHGGGRQRQRQRRVA